MGAREPDGRRERVVRQRGEEVGAHRVGATAVDVHRRTRRLAGVERRRRARRVREVDVAAGAGEHVRGRAEIAVGVHGQAAVGLDDVDQPVALVGVGLVAEGDALVDVVDDHAAGGEAGVPADQLPVLDEEVLARALAHLELPVHVVGVRPQPVGRGAGRRRRQRGAVDGPDDGGRRQPALVGLRERVHPGRGGPGEGRADPVPAAGRHRAPLGHARAGEVGVVEVGEADVVTHLVDHDPDRRLLAGRVAGRAHPLAEHGAAGAVHDGAVELGRRVVQAALVTPHAVAADVALAAVRRLVARHDHRDMQLGDAERAVLVGVEGRVVDVRVGGRDGVDAELGLRGVVVVAEVRVVVGELQPADHPVVGHAGALGGRHERELPEAVGLVVAGDAAAGAEEVLGPLVLGAADAGLVGEGHQDDQAGLRAVARAGRPSGCPGLGGGPSGAGTLDDLRPQPARGGRRRGLADLEVGRDGPSRGVEPDGVPPDAGGVLRDGVAALGLVAAGA